MSFEWKTVTKTALEKRKKELAQQRIPEKYKSLSLRIVESYMKETEGKEPRLLPLPKQYKSTISASRAIGRSIKNMKLEGQISVFAYDDKQVCIEPVEEAKEVTHVLPT